MAWKNGVRGVHLMEISAVIGAGSIVEWQGRYRRHVIIQKSLSEGYIHDDPLIVLHPLNSETH
jgi:hypothetical protein